MSLKLIAVGDRLIRSGRYDLTPRHPATLHIGVRFGVPHRIQFVRDSVRRETLVTVELEPSSTGGTRLTLSHAGFPDEETRDGHAEAWPLAMAHLDEPLRD